MKSDADLKTSLINYLVTKLQRIEYEEREKRKNIIRRIMLESDNFGGGSSSRR